MLIRLLVDVQSDQHPLFTYCINRFSYEADTCQYFPFLSPVFVVFFKLMQKELNTSPLNILFLNNDLMGKYLKDKKHQLLFCLLLISVLPENNNPSLLLLAFDSSHSTKVTRVALYLSRVMRKPAFCISENKGADQLCSNREACFHYIDSTMPLLPKSEIISLIARFVSNLVGNPEDRFSRDAAHFGTFLTALDREFL